MTWYKPVNNPHTAPLAAPTIEPRPTEPEMAPPTAPAAAPTPPPTTVPVATRPAFPLPSSAPAASANFLQSSISCAATSFPTEFKCALGYRTGCAVEQATSNNDPTMTDKDLRFIVLPILSYPSRSSMPAQTPRWPL